MNGSAQSDGDVQPNGAVRSCKLDGDFFVEAPDDSASAEFLHAIEQALVAGASVQSVIDSHPDCNLIGTDAKAIETAFTRALEQIMRHSVASTASLTSVMPQAPIRKDPIYKASIYKDSIYKASIYKDSIHKASIYKDSAQHSAVPGVSAMAAGVLPDNQANYASRWAQLLPQLTVIHDQPRLPAEQMRIDENWAREVASGLRPPTLRIWEWAAPAVVIGRFQSAPDEVNLDIAKQRGFSVVRRCTGGGAMFIEPGNTITYSLYAPLDFVQGVSIEESYRLCDWWLVEALRELGLDVRFSGLNDIASQYGKIGGAAQRRFPVVRGDGIRQSSEGTGADGRGASQTVGVIAGAVLHHVTLAYDIDAVAMGEVLNTSREKMSDKAVKSAVKRVDPLRSQTGLRREQVIDHLLAWLVERGGEPSGRPDRPGQPRQSLVNKS
ncbi:biotin/lipoate A/B protein ligase family protein [Bifidobacterium sp. UTBIF-68]|uniref:lipoate--protein ligase family protein n=1 Tax=Bifidobacterium sp. UTBIF-68 TaxID=1465262 RepID=UPI0035C21212